MKICLIVYDNDAYISQFPIGIAQLTAVLEKAGHEVSLYLQDINHFPDECITEYLDSHYFDMVGLSFIGGYWQYKKAVSISEAINKSRQRPKIYAIGGHGPSPEPEFFIRKMKADIVCIGEGDETILEIAKGKEFSDILGIAYLKNGDFFINERRPLIADIDSLPLPAYHRFPMDIYRLMRMPNCSRSDFVIPILSGRGCTFKCNFCYRMDKGFRPRSNESIIEEIKFLQKNYGITYIAFYDELLISSVERATLLCEDIIKSNLKIKYYCQGRLNFAKPELLNVMKKSGCVFINYGIECFDNTILKNMHKGLTTSQIERGIRATLDCGISPGLNIIFGNIGEDRETLFKGVDFLLKYDDHSQLRTIRPVTPYPGCELYYDAIQSGKLKNVEDFYENKHTNSDLLSINFTNLTDDQFYAALYDANSVLLENYTGWSKKRYVQELQHLYKNKNAEFRGFRHT